MGVNQLGAPLAFHFASGKFRSGKAEAGEANMVIGPVTAFAVRVRRAFAFIQLRADQHVNHQAIFHVHAAHLARRKRGMATQLTDDMNRVTAIDNLRIAGDQNPDVVQMTHGARQRSGHIAQPTGFHQISQLGGHEQHFAPVDLRHGLLGRCRRHLQHR